MNMFKSVAVSKPKLNKFDLSHDRKMSLNMGKLVPIVLQEILPGDSFKMRSEIMLRFAPMLAPVMHMVNVYTHYFFVPNRLVWQEWEEFITGGSDGTQNPIHPYLTCNDTNKVSFAKGSLADYFGFPVVDPADTITNPINISALPFRAYRMIYDEYYRDQSLQAPGQYSKGSGDANTDLPYVEDVLNRCWEKDYFTSCLPWAQRGDEVLIPLEGEVTYKDASEIKYTIGGGPAISENLLASPTGHLSDNIGNDTTQMRIENIDGVSNAVVTINDLRTSVKIQEWLEKNARGGARYIEQILSHFGVVSSDARLQRPQYLGGGLSPVVISEVLSTVQETAENIPQGNMSGHGFSVGTTNGFTRRFEEHGFVIGIMSVMPRTAYQQGCPKFLRRFDRFDYGWPELAHLGEQAVTSSELYYDAVTGIPGQNDELFGYQSRYAEYKYTPSSVHGDMRDDLSFWHLARIFSAKPELNETFVEAIPSNRIFAVTDDNIHHLYCQVYNRISALRPLPYFGTPKF